MFSSQEDPALMLDTDQGCSSIASVFIYVVHRNYLHYIALTYKSLMTVEVEPEK